MRVLLVDDHFLFVEAMLNLFDANGIAVVGTAMDGMEALEQARKLNPDVILMDIYMKGCDGIAATRMIKAEMPDIKIVMLTASENTDDLFEAIKSGACGYLLKKLHAKDLMELFIELEKGEPPLAPGLAIKILEKFACYQQKSPEPSRPKKTEVLLTQRQRAILKLVAQGKSYRQVAESLFFSERTIKYEIKAILDCLHVKNRAEAIAYASRIGLTNSMAGKETVHKE